MLSRRTGWILTNGLIGKKLGMTQVFDESRLTPVTVIEAGPMPSGGGEDQRA